MPVLPFPSVANVELVRGLEDKGQRERHPLSSVFCPLSSHTGAGRPLFKWLLGGTVVGARGPARGRCGA